MQILLVEDDYALASGLQQALEHEGFVVNSIATGEAALHIVKTDPPNIVILDIGLPDINGLTVLKTIRQMKNNIPVLLLTARDSVQDKVTGLGMGADDYLAKPFDIQELIARLRVFERRLGTSNTNVIAIGAVVMNTEAQQVMVDGVALDLARREYMLLKALMENAGKIQSKETLEAKLYSWGDEISSNAVEVHIHHLRKKLPENFIHTIRGIGYTVKKT